jgi:hypothetical protein
LKFFSLSKKLLIENNFNEIEQITPRLEHPDLFQLRSMENSKIKEISIKKEEKISPLEKKLSTEKSLSNNFRKKIIPILKLIQKLKSFQCELKVLSIVCIYIYIY